MPNFNRHPSIDENDRFAQPVIDALMDSDEFTAAAADRIANAENPVRVALDGLYISLSPSTVIDGGLP
jgi:hypothetical protein